MDEEELKKAREKIAYLRAMGKEGRAMNLERKIEQKIIKKKYKENKGPSGISRILKKGKEVLSKTKDAVVDAAEDVAEKVTPVINKIKKPVVKESGKSFVKETPVVKESGKSFVGKGLTELDKPTTTSLQGAVGQAYEGGTSDEITKNGIVYKRGEDSYDAVAKELLASTEKKIKKKK
jgi:hypothetical protein